MAEGPCAAAVVRSMLLPTKLRDRHNWETFTDPSTGCSYLYDSATGESRWLGSAAEQARAALRGEAMRAPVVHALSPVVELEMVAPSVGDILRNEDFDDGYRASDDKAIDAANQRTWKKKGMLRTVQQNRRPQLAGCDRICDRIAVITEVACCEQPAACLEALCRSPGYLLGAVLLYILSALVCVSRGCDCAAGGRVSAKACGYLREGCLFLASFVSLLVPGVAFLVYRDMPLSDDGDWHIRPLPTIIGNVDPRRFWAFSLGRCALADDGFYDPALGSLDWPWAGPVLHPPRTERPAALGFFEEHGETNDDDERGESVV